MKSNLLFIPLLGILLLASCTSEFAAMQGKKEYHDLALDELRIEVADIKHTLSTQQMEISLLEDKIRDKDHTISSLTKEMSGKKILKLEQFFEEISSLERKISQLERIQEKTTVDVRQLSVHANQASAALGQYRDKIHDLERELQVNLHKLEEIGKIRNTLSSISKAVSGKPSTGFTTYKVKSGDTLGKIAQDHHITVETLKKYNDLANDKIFVGKELKIPYAE